MMKIYTRTGDKGETGLFAGPRVPKDHLRIWAYGSVDELNSVLGVVRAEWLPTRADKLLGRIQNELFIVGAQLATPQPVGRFEQIDDTHIRNLEEAIDGCESRLPPLKQFILPGGTRAAAELHLARTVCRRAERQVVTLYDETKRELSPHLLSYLNRLSDLLFVLARFVNHQAGNPDVPWERSSGP